MKFFPRESVKFAILLAVALGSGPAGAAFWQWSKTASSNGSADPSINWAEGMSPSSVNDSARAMMARAAEYRDDISGLLATAGTSSAYTVTTNQGLNATPNDGQMISVTAHTTNAASATLAADGGTAFPIQTSAGTAIPLGVLIQGTAYSLKFSTSSSAWILRDFYGNPFSVPLGAVLEFSGGSVPNSNFVFANGQCISRTTYAGYFALVGTTYGVCDGSTTFGVPDKRGRVSAGLDNMGGTTSQNRLNIVCSSTVISAGCGAQQVTLGTGNLPPYTPSGSVSAPSQTDPQAFYWGGSIANGTLIVLLGTSNGAIGQTTVGSAVGGSNGAPTFFGNAQGGSSTPFNTVQPTLMMNFIIRVI